MTICRFLKKSENPLYPFKKNSINCVATTVILHNTNQKREIKNTSAESELLILTARRRVYP